MSSGLAPNNSHTRDVLLDKHPIGQAVPRDIFASAQFPQAVEEDSVEKAIKSFPRLSAGGPSGWKAQHLQDALNCPAYNASVLQVMTQFTDLLVKGHAPVAFAPYLAGAGLVALSKEGGDVRPIAIGEVFRRIASKTLCIEFKGICRQFFWHLQVGMGSLWDVKF